MNTHVDPAIELDLATQGLRTINQTLQHGEGAAYVVQHPAGQHAIACGLNRHVDVTVDGHAGFYCAGMNQLANVRVSGHSGVGVAENMMSGRVHVTGNASQAAGATAHGGLLVIEGNASSRCGISMKGIDIVVGGSVGHMSAFMAQKGNLVVLGDAGDALGDSIYEARLFIRGSVASLGTDCIEKPMEDSHRSELAALLERSGMTADVNDFKRYGSARELYHFNIDNASAY